MISQPLPHRVAPALGVKSGLDQKRICERQGCAGQGPLEAADAALGADEPARAGDMENVPVPPVDEQARHLAGAVLLVTLDIDDVPQRTIRVKRHERRVRGEEPAGGGRERGRNENQAVDAAVAPAMQPRGVVAPVVQREHGRVFLVPFCGRQDAAEDFEKVKIELFAIHHAGDPDRMHAGAGQSARGRVRSIAEARRGRQDALAGFRPDPRRGANAVERRGCRHR